MGVLAGLDNLAQLKQRHHFVDARRREPGEFVYFGPVEKSPVLKDFGNGASKLPLEVLEGRSGIHLACMKTGPAVSGYQSGMWSDLLAEAVSEGVSRICRKEMDSIVALSAVEQSDGGGAGGSGLSYSTFPDEEKDALFKKPGWIVLWPVCGWFPGHGAANGNGLVLAEHSCQGRARFTESRMTDRRRFRCSSKRFQRYGPARAHQAVAA